MAGGAIKARKTRLGILAFFWMRGREIRGWKMEIVCIHNYSGKFYCKGKENVTGGTEALRQERRLAGFVCVFVCRQEETCYREVCGCDRRRPR